MREFIRPLNLEPTVNSMPNRRSTLALMASFVGLPLSGPAAAFVASGPEIRRYGRHFIVNGWLLTAGDLRMLGLRAD
jgi:hypothetical protein